MFFYKINLGSEMATNLISVSGARFAFEMYLPTFCEINICSYRVNSSLKINIGITLLLREFPYLTLNRNSIFIGWICNHLQYLRLWWFGIPSKSYYYAAIVSQKRK